MPTPAERQPWRLALLFAAPCLLLSLCWVFSNPPGAAPDETDHLVKAIGNSRLELGTKVPPLPAGGPLILERNNSTTRGFTIPADLVPTGYTCFAFDNTKTAACLPGPSTPSAGDTVVYSALGDYPPFFYVPVGLAAQATHSPADAIHVARLVILLMSYALLVSGLTHLIRWLGRSAALGYTALLTPFVVFLNGSLSPSALELSAATGVAAVVTVALMRPDTVHLPSTHWHLAVSGSALVLSRQLGLFAMVGLMAILLVAIGWPRIRRLVTDRQSSFVTAVALMGLATVAVTWWERSYDHPAHVGSPFNADAVTPFLTASSFILTSAIGNFGWLDTPMPGQASGVWTGLWILLISLAFLVGRKRESWVIALVVLGTGALGFGIYASAFYPIQGGIQGRQFLPIFCLSLILSGAVVVRRLSDSLPQLTTRMFWGVGVTVGVIQSLALYANGRRYAVGMDGPWWWVSKAEWSPVLGWTPWLILGLLFSIFLAAVVIAFRPRPAVNPIDA